MVLCVQAEAHQTLDLLHHRSAVRLCRRLHAGAQVRSGPHIEIGCLHLIMEAWSSADNVIAKLTDKGAKFRCLQQAGANTDSGMGKLVLAVLGAVAEFETDLRKDRQREGIAKAKAKGVYKGRKPSVPATEIRSLREAGVSPSEIARKLGVGRTSVYRALGLVE